MYDRHYFSGDRRKTLLFVRGSPQLWFRTFLRLIRQYNPSGKLLDIGCGTGEFLEIAQPYYACYGFDISEYAIRMIENRKIRVKVWVADVSYLSRLKVSWFDVVTCFDVLEHVQDPKETLVDIRKILRQGGILSMRVPNADSIGRVLKGTSWFAQRDPTHVSLLSHNEWLRVLHESGFKLIKRFYDGLWDPPYIRIMPNFLQQPVFKIVSLLFFSLGLIRKERLGENLCILAKRA